MPPISPADRLAGKKPRQITVGVYLDESLANAVDAATLLLQEAKKVHADPADIGTLKATLDDARAALDEGTEWLTFRAMGRHAFARLVAEHPPTDEVIARAEEAGADRPDFDPATFGPALIAAACAAPLLTPADVNRLYEADGWNEVELGALFAAALSVNTRARPLNVRSEEA